MPPPERRSSAQLTAFLRWLAERDRSFTSYKELWAWSVEDMEGFWLSVAAYFGLGSLHPPVLVEGGTVAAARWFPDATVNYAAVALSHDPRRPAAIELDCEGPAREITFGELRLRSAQLAGALTRAGLRPGDRVAAVLPNGIDALSIFLGCARAGIVWSCLSPELGDRALEARLRALKPNMVFVCGAYSDGVTNDDPSRRVLSAAKAVARNTPVVLVGDVASGEPGLVALEDLVADDSTDPGILPLPFAHPLWVLFTSGTTGTPRGIVHGHGSIVLEHLKVNALHFDLQASDRFMWLTSSGWVAWNLLVGGLLVGCTVVLDRARPTLDGGRRVWRQVVDQQVSALALSPAFLESCRARGVDPRELPALSLRTLVTSGSPLSPGTNQWLRTTLGSDLYVANVSGGTEFATILLGATPDRPVRDGRLQHAALGVRVEALDDGGLPVPYGEVGELAVVGPMPSMPVGLLGDRDGEQLANHYLKRFRGVWCHGDLVEFASDGSAAILGRSDGTLKRNGIRLGAAEYYEELLLWPEVVDAMVVDVPGEEGGGHIVLLVELAPGVLLDEKLAGSFRQRIRAHLSPRHTPDKILALPRVPRNHNGKRLEVPVRNLLARRSGSLADHPDADPATLEVLEKLAADSADLAVF